MAKRKPAAKSRKKTETPWEQIGLVTISTGSLLLIDPVDVNEYDDADRSDSDYEVELGKTKGTAVVTTTGMGDGIYLVEGRYHRYEDPGQPADIRLAEIRVKFLDDEGNQVCYEPRGAASGK